MTRPEALAKFGDRCMICGVRDGEAGGRHGTLSVDHRHSDGVVRGMLCPQCNYGVGQFRDRSDLLRRAADYLDAHP